jgi:hypothetical protein
MERRGEKRIGDQVLEVAVSIQSYRLNEGDWMFLAQRGKVDEQLRWAVQVGKRSIESVSVLAEVISDESACSRTQ